MIIVLIIVIVTGIIIIVTAFNIFAINIVTIVVITITPLHHCCYKEDGSTVSALACTEVTSSIYQY